MKSWISDWDRLVNLNAVTGILGKPSDADGVDTFDFGEIFDWSHDQCEAKCIQQPGCVAYSQFPTWYSDVNFFAACVGRSNKYNVLEPDSDVLSGVSSGSGIVQTYSEHCTLYNCSTFFLSCHGI